MPIFRVKSVKIYTGQKKFTRTLSVASMTNIRYVSTYPTSPHQGFLCLKSLKASQGLANHLKASQLDSKAPQHVQVCEARTEGTNSAIITTLDLLCEPWKTMFKADPSKKPPTYLIGPLNRNSGHGWPQSQNKPLLVTCGNFEPFSDTPHLTSEPSITNLLRRWQDVPTRQSRVSVAALR